ncbi:DUF4132 domain-containing protein [Glycomyces algeriensis]|uniref:DUF4132 domain-containing protein n=1 Tax=Glycomyces algeriensis TaxID=256037 RepID=A0A9W6GDA5_9ACTN|nr:DUF4132 domain-containing protein [Glycomyces algeriensis]MDA1367828.1 DUF4132 domain-containing protein [Glycomyces algeriensis]MDR7351974.1 hypothetical protein [Glycomyces algeriensis]GLI44707.1 hypothetical protein GALLR39Z86_45570 [Glycomyces algeriensis]
MTDRTAPQEDRLNPPPEWTANVLPRRSNGVRGRFVLAADASDLVREQIERCRAELTSALEKPSGDPVLAQAGLDFLADAPSPTGAAAVTRLLRHTDRYRDWSKSRAGTPLDRELFSAWVIEFGLPFAIGAAAAGAGITTGWDHPGGATKADPLPFVTAADPHAAHWTGSRFLGELELSRELTAAAEPDEYEAVVAAAAAHREALLQRAAAALLLPDETAWVAATCEELARTEHASGLQHLMWSAISSVDHRERLGRKAIEAARLTAQDVAELVCHLGVAALPVLEATLAYKSLTAAQRTALLDGIALLPSDDATALLIDRSGEPQVLPAALRSAARFPLRTARIAAERAPRLAPLDRTRLAVIVRSDPAGLDAALPHLNDTARAAITDLTSSTALPVADAARLPQILVAPPWTNTERPAPAPLRGLEPPADIEIIWAPEEHERALSVEPNFWSWDDDEYWASVKGEVVNRVDLSLEAGIWSRLARHGPAAADAVAERLRTKHRYGSALVPIRSATAATVVADWFLRLKSTRAHALDWLDRHGEVGATLLIPAAFGSSKRYHAGGQAALRHLAGQLGPEAVVRSAERYGPDAVQRVQALLATDPLMPLGDPPRPGAWADPQHLPPVLLRERDAVLPPGAVTHLITILALSAPRVHHPGTDIVAQHCDAESLTQFSHALFQLWLSAGAPPADTWAVDQLARFGTDATAALLEPLVLTWPGGDQSDRAGYALYALAAIGTETAFNVLHRMSRLRKYPVTTALARKLAAQVASGFGEDVETLADRLVPDLGVGDPESLALDYGPRRFHVRFDERLRPSLVDGAGKQRLRLPQPGVRDDADLAAAAKTRYQRLAKDLERLVAEQTERLDDAMYSGRTWTVPEFRLIARHPVLGSLVSRLVWLADHDGTRFGFRTAEDGGFADAHEKLVGLPDAATIRLAHPALLGEELPAWNEIFNDYAILQPIEQLGRPPFTAAEAATGQLTRFEGVEMHTGTLRGHMSWVNRYPQYGDWGTQRRGFERRVPGGYLLADASTGAPVTDSELGEWHRVHAVRLVTTRNRKAAKPLRGDRLDPVTASELLADLTAAVRR